MRANPAGASPAPSTQAPHHEGGSQEVRHVEDLIREAHQLLAVAGVSRSTTKIVRACREYARRPRGAFRYFLAGALAQKDSTDYRHLMMSPTTRPRPVKQWEAMGSQHGAWPVTSGGGAHG